MDESVKRRWAEFLNPDVVRSKFVAMGLFMVAHEMLLDAIRERPRSYYSNTWSAGKGWIPSADYSHKVLALDPKGKQDALRGSIAWMEKMGVVNDADIAAIRKFTDARNTIAHQLSEIVSGGQMPDFSSLFPSLVGLVTKIERWWIINFEIATDPELMGHEFDEEAVKPGTVLILQMLSEVALGDDENAWKLFRHFSEPAG